MKRICLYFLLLLVSGTIHAQTDFFTTSRFEEGDRFENLDGNCGVLILSKSNDLVITATNTVEKISIVFKGERPDGLYEYLVVIDEKDTRKPNIEISRRGNVYNTKILPTVKTDFALAYRVGEYAHPIRLDRQQRPNDAHLNAKEALLEFTTTIKNLQVEFSPKLGAALNRKTSTSDRNKSTIQVTIPVAALDKAKKAWQDIAAERAELEKRLQQEGDKALETDWTRLDTLEVKETEAANLYAELTSFVIYTDGSNRLALDPEEIGQLGPRSKLSFAVLPLIIEKKVFVTQCASYLNQAGQYFAQRDYKEARTAYANALNAKDALQEMLPVIRESIAQCDSCLLYSDLAAKSIAKFSKLAKQGTSTQEEVARYASAAISYMQTLNNYKPDDFYTTRIQKLENLLNDMPLKIRFTIVEWLTLNEGDYLPDVEVWAYHGVDPVSSTTYGSDKKFLKLAEKNAQDYKQLSTSGSNGIAEIELDRSNLPTGIIFRPGKDRNIKIKYMTIAELFRQAKGTYNEKRFRLKMFTK